MREILFRGKQKYNGEWIISGNVFFGESLKYMYFHNPDNDPVENAFVCREVIPETVGQYTGLTDKNGKKIFEGDIVKCEYSKGQYQYFKVIYNEKTYRWETENKYGMLGQLCNVFGECEVIGNIHDTPELLKEGADNS